MQAIDKLLTTPNWVSAFIFVSLVLLVLLKQLNQHRFRNTVTSLFNKGSLEIEIEESSSTFNVYSVLFTLFSFIIISLLLYLLVSEIVGFKEYTLNNFLSFSFLVVCYMMGRFFLEFCLIHILDLKLKLKFFFLSKRIFLYAISVVICFLLILFVYSNLNHNVFFMIATVLFFIRFLSILVINKNLIFSHLFYFILYLCAFEIAPLLILYKMITK